MNVLQHVPLWVWALLARPLFAPALASEEQHLTVPGSWAPLALYLLIFSLRFVHGISNARNRRLLQTSNA